MASFFVAFVILFLKSFIQNHELREKYGENENQENLHIRDGHSTVCSFITMFAGPSVRKLLSVPRLRCYGNFCYYFGPISGMTVGGMGVVLYCLIISGLRGMPGWFVGNLIIGLIVGLTCKATKRVHNQVARQAIIIASVVLSTGVGILGAKSLVETILYAQPFVLRVAQNSFAFVADVIVLSISIPICLAIQPIVYKSFPELKT